MDVVSRTQSIRRSLDAFVHDLLQSEIARIRDPESKASQERRSSLVERFQTQRIIDTAAPHAKGISIATHISKGIYPDAKGPDILVDCRKLPGLEFVGSHVLGDTCVADATGNAAYNPRVFDLYRILQVKIGEITLFDCLLASDPAAIAALHANSTEAKELAAAITQMKINESSHSLHAGMKQIYWLIGENPHSDDQFHLLAPLFPTSFSRVFHERLREIRFGEQARLAREAMKSGKWFDGSSKDYPALGVLKIGGTRPLNISQLNFARQGESYLLSSAPPVWQLSTTGQWYGGRTSLFQYIGLGQDIKDIFQRFLGFLQSDPSAKLETRSRVREFVDELLDVIVEKTAEAREFEPGWSKDERCRLRSSHKMWLDPYSFDEISDELHEILASDFSRWMNVVMQKKIPVGDVEFAYWNRLGAATFREMQPEEKRGVPK